MNVFSEFKNEFISNVMNNQTILKCLYYTSDDGDILNMADITDPKIRRTIYKENFYKQRKLPTDSMKEQKTYLSLEFGTINYTSVQQSRSWDAVTIPFWTTPILYVYIITHQSLDDNDYIGSRLETIEYELKEMFHNKQVMTGFGRSFLVTSEPLINLQSDFIGRRLQIQFRDFNGTVTQ